MIRRDRSPGIQTTPFSDLAFLLLIFFVVTTIFPTEKGLAMLLPNDRGTTRVPRSQVVILAIGSEGTLYWDEHEIAFDELKPRIEQRMIEREKTVFQIQTDGEASYEHFVDVLDELKVAGASFISVKKRL